MNDIAAVILAGGYGTRVKHLLPNIPKPMASVVNKPFLEWIIRYLKQQGINKEIISTGYLGEVIEEHFKTHQVKGVDIYCCCEDEPLGTAGGFINAVQQVSLSPKAWLVMNGDSLIVANFQKLEKYLEDKEVGCVILGVSVNDASRYGSLVFDQSHNLLNFAEKKAGQGVINGGVYLFRHETLEQFPSKFPLSFEYDVFPTLLKEKVIIKVHPIEAPFLDIGTPETLPQAEAFIKENFTNLLEPC
ncbi:putative nucleotidyl transferase [Crocosphaera subtropica ATCC 51142]|uniref:Nucleotidyl transferase n=1 Tax=Crocosphaera subtropica (strain ATCC 51142 / BH68) TaxID=43989 RepID=B1WSY6_CROS5|nr:nucleotidyltransferase family protein [Crocosphaera subtropica]ACB50316.1 putative nucleotidyl transferase [Crocosphaera subtropica ATCC 51142]